MDCKQYQSWLNDEALGGLSPASGAELRSHLAACADCRAELERRRAFLSAMDHAVATSSAGEPSPDFAAQVRARVAEHPAPAASGFAGWVPWAAGAVAVAALLVFFLIPKDSPTTSQPATPTARNTAPTPPGHSAAPLVAVPPKAVLAKAVPEPRLRTRVPEAPEVLIPPEQRAGIEWLSRALRQRPVQTATLLADMQARAQRQTDSLRPDENKIRPLEIPPVQRLTGSEGYSLH